MLLTYRALVDVLQQKRPATGALLVGVDGPGGSGKSTIAKGLSGACDQIQVVHVDDFYRPSAERYAGSIASRPIGSDFDLNRVRVEVLEPLRAGLSAGYHIYDWATDRVSPRVVPIAKPIVVVEGVYSLSASLAEFFEFAIWVTCPRDVRLARGIERDGEEGRPRWEHDWMVGEDQYIERERPQDRASLVCDGSHADPSGVWIDSAALRAICGEAAPPMQP